MGQAFSDKSHGRRPWTGRDCGMSEQCSSALSRHPRFALAVLIISYCLKVRSNGKPRPGRQLRRRAWAKLWSENRPHNAPIWPLGIGLIEPNLAWSA